MFGQRFQHLFPSPQLSQPNQQTKTEQTAKRQNYHMNAQTLKNRIPDFKKIEKQANQYRRLVSNNRNRFMASVESLERIRRSLTPTFRAPKGKNPIVTHRIPLKNQGLEAGQKQEIIVVDLYRKILLYKTEYDETPMTFIKGKIDIFTQKQSEGIIIIHKLNNYSDNQYDCLSCRLIATKNHVKKNQVQLLPSDYQIVMAGFINNIISPRSSNKGLEIKGPWIPPLKSHPYLTLILCDERARKILFTTSCFSLQQVIERALKKDQVDQKIF